jgi:hypothetical protein
MGRFSAALGSFLATAHLGQGGRRRHAKHVSRSLYLRALRMEWFEERALLDATPTGASYMLYENWGGTWCDVEKTPSNTEDDLLCWAAAASNVLEWTGWGMVGSFSNTDDIFAHFQDHWQDEGGWPDNAMEWWFDGEDHAFSGSDIDVSGGGGFWPSENFGDYHHQNDDES